MRFLADDLASSSVRNGDTSNNNKPGGVQFGDNDNNHEAMDELYSSGLKLEPSPTSSNASKNQKKKGVDDQGSLMS